MAFIVKQPREIQFIQKLALTVQKIRQDIFVICQLLSIYLWKFLSADN